VPRAWGGGGQGLPRTPSGSAGRYGPNALPEHEVDLGQKSASFHRPDRYMIEAAAIVSAARRGTISFIIAGLLVFNAGLEFWQDIKASTRSPR
jgi:H+-transporting ATPase